MSTWISEYLNYCTRTRPQTQTPAMSHYLQSTPTKSSTNHEQEETPMKTTTTTTTTTTRSDQNNRLHITGWALQALTEDHIADCHGLSADLVMSLAQIIGDRVTARVQEDPGGFIVGLTTELVDEWVSAKDATDIDAIAEWVEHYRAQLVDRWTSYQEMYKADARRRRQEDGGSRRDGNPRGRTRSRTRRDTLDKLRESRRDTVDEIREGFARLEDMASDRGRSVPERQQGSDSDVDLMVEGWALGLIAEERYDKEWPLSDEQVRSLSRTAAQCAADGHLDMLADAFECVLVDDVDHYAAVAEQVAKSLFDHGIKERC